MEKLKNFTEEQLIKRANEYYVRMNNLLTEISNYLNHKSGKKEYIQEEYTVLKEKMREEQRYFDANKNSIMNKSEVHNCYQSGVTDAAVSGFMTRKDARVSWDMYDSVQEAVDNLGYYMDEYFKKK